VREGGVYCEIVPFNKAEEALAAYTPKAVILSGGPASVTESHTPRAPARVFELGVPVLGICYGHQTMMAQLGGRVEPSTKREFGRATIEVTGQSPLFEGVWALGAEGDTRLHGFDGELTVDGGDRDQLAAGEFLRRAALIGVDVGGLGADDGVVGLGESFEAEHVGGGAVEDEEDVDAVAEMFLKFLGGRLRMRVVAIADHVAVVDGGEGTENVGMDPCIIVAGKAAGRFHGGINLTEVAAENEDNHRGAKGTSNHKGHEGPRSD